jgi:chromosome segregation protein
MRLKRVRMFGFKTFADRTEFELDGGVIAVVGPNGCGKSNLVDAILWGLGEGSAKQLRAQTGQDVIFNGSARRKGVGYCEVNLTFDNEDGALPVDTPEVSVSRKLNRAGESEYSINRQTCRQRDVLELMADSGLGRAGYAIVGQKEIDQALNASVEDRRAWIDEAAGVQRYRSRKVEALRRLSTAQEHLQRVTDILTELEAQREPLRDEAEVATRYRRIQSTLREIEVGYLLSESSAAKRDQQNQENHISRTTELSEAESARATKLESLIQDRAAHLAALDKEADGLRSRRQELLRSIERTQGDIRLGLQKLESLDEREQSLAADREESRQRITEAEIELVHATEDEETERSALLELQSSIAGIGEEAQRLSGALQTAERELAAARKHEMARVKAEAERAQRQQRSALARRELKTLLASLPDLETAVRDAESNVSSIRARSEDMQARIRELEAALQAKRIEEEEDARAAREALSERASLEGRQRGILATIEAFEGLAQGARAVMEAARAGLLSAEYVPVGQAIEVEREYAVAIETALGGSTNDLIVETEVGAKDAIDWLKQNRAGRATFQPVPLIRQQQRGQEIERLLSDRDVVGIAADLVECHAAHRPVIERLLGRVLVVRDLDASLRLARTGGWSRLVSLEGELVHSSGAVTGGLQERRGYGLVQRKADLAEIERAVSRLARLVGGYEKRSAEREASLASIRTEIGREAASKEAIASELAESESFFRALTEELKSTQREKEKLERELSEQLKIPEIEKIDVAAIEDRRDEALRALAARSADVEQTRERLREAEDRAAQASIRREGAARRLENAKGTAESRDRRAEGIEPERLRVHEQILGHEKALETAKQASAEVEERLEGSQARKRELMDDESRAREELAKVRETIADMAAAMHQAELNRTRAEARRSAALLRLIDEYGMTEDEADAQHGGSEPPSDAPAVVQRLRRELRAMGEVNLGAIEAYERLTKRFEELESQRNDVAGGIVEVENTIRELDKLTRDRFVMTFDQVSAAFAEMFERLFGGGDGRLLLADPSDILNTGIEIEVTLPGKRRQYLNLLSGGERALCTCAFLFALLKVKPAPLVILDEVDAPLDGRNVERFAEALADFTDRTQFILITHNPVTIASAPVWIGVSMEEPGISKLLPIRIPPGEDRSAKATTLAG